MSDELIERLATDLKPIRPWALQRLLGGAVLISGAIAAVVMLLWLGPRADMATAPGTMMFWTKFGYTLALALTGGVATLALARPDGHTRWTWITAVGLVMLVLIGGIIQLAMAAPEAAMPLVVGGTSLVCPWRIVALGCPVLVATLLTLRRMAPGSPAMAGFSAGIMSGALGAWVYSFACGENGMMFLALWYTLGIAIVGAVGALLGRFLLRW